MRRTSLMLVVCFLSVVFLAGCGATGSSKTSTSQGAKGLEFTSTDMPTKLGFEWRYFQNEMVNPDNPVEKRPPADVAFSLEGPWDFSAGPTENEVVDTTVARASTPESVTFPDADFVVRRDVSLATAFVYKQNRRDTLAYQGDATQTIYSKVLMVSIPTVPQVLLSYPLTKGKTWSESYTENHRGWDEPPETGSRSYRVTGVSSIKVPFASYAKAFMVQTKVQPQGKPSEIWYNWYVPKVGLVAVVQSVDGEVNEVFTKASRIIRLKYFGKATTATPPTNSQ